MLSAFEAHSSEGESELKASLLEFNQQAFPHNSIDFKIFHLSLPWQIPFYALNLAHDVGVEIHAD